MTRILQALLALTMLPPLLPHPAFAESKSIYGRDDRAELFDASPETRRLADSVVSLWKSEDMQYKPAAGTFSFNTKKLADDPTLCLAERFQEQPMGAFCSGSLVGDDLVLTAGHCVRDQAMCDSARIVFGFAIKTFGASVPEGIGAKDVYSCKEVLVTLSDTVPPRPDPFAEYLGPDYALIRLDRKVAGRKPLEINRSRRPKKGDKLLAIGHPLGLPLKIAAGAAVRDPSQADYFVTDLDTFGGSSGSPVFSAATGLIEGVLVRGDADFDVVPGTASAPSGGFCYTLAAFPQSGGRGEDVSRISALEHLIPEPAAGGRSAGPAIRDVAVSGKAAAEPADLSRYFSGSFQ